MCKKFDSAVLIAHRKHIHTPNEFISLLHIAILKNVQFHNTFNIFFLVL